jgi:hypothetical protein
MNRNNAETRLDGIDIDNDVSLFEFMSRNYDHDPDWFTEPENSPDYGPPGMPTPWNPADPRIADRQRHISNTLRQLLNPDILPVDTDPYMIEMFQLNFDSFNTILGMNNNDSYSRWKTHNNLTSLDARLSEIEDAGVLGLASQEELAEFILNTEGMKSVEFWRLFHAYKFRMRHLESRRDETKQMILGNGGEIASEDRPHYFGLKLFPYVNVTYREPTQEERRQIALINTSRLKKQEIFDDLARGHTQAYADGKIVPTEIQDALSHQIDQDNAEVEAIIEKMQVHTTEGLMATIKKDIGMIPKNEKKSIRVVERQLFGIDISSQKNTDSFQELMHDIRTKKELNARVKQVYSNIYGHFMEMSPLIVPASTTTYGFETDASSLRYDDTTAGILANIAIGGTTRLRQ